MNTYFKTIAEKLFSQTAHDEHVPDDLPQEALPVVWLLGKTAAGKSSLIQCLTGLPHENRTDAADNILNNTKNSAKIGNGFEPCTRATQGFDFPSQSPLLRFLDTRGLDEVAYDPASDIRECQDRSHVLLVLARMDDPVQHGLANIVGEITKQSPSTPVVLVHNAADTLSDDKQRARARSANHALFEQAVGKSLRWVETALPLEQIGPAAPGVTELLDILIEIMPDAALALMQENGNHAEQEAFNTVQSKVLGHAGAAASADLAPAIGAVAVPAIQANLLRAIAQTYEARWTRQQLRDFSLALGTGVLLRFGGSYLSRQLAKFIPVYGQTLGALAAGTISFATTYALGRASAYYLYHLRNGTQVNTEKMRELYKTSLTQAIKTRQAFAQNKQTSAQKKQAPAQKKPVPSHTSSNTHHSEQ